MFRRRTWKIRTTTFIRCAVDVVRGGKVLSETKRVDFRAGRQARVSFDSFGAAERSVRTALVR